MRPNPLMPTLTMRSPCRPASIAPCRSKPIRWRGDALELLNQLLLPRKVEYVKCSTSHEVADSIRSMVVRGAPAIGVAAAFGMALAKMRREISGFAARELKQSRPTAVNLAWAVDRMLRANGEVAEAEAIFAKHRSESPHRPLRLPAPRARATY